MKDHIRQQFEILTSHTVPSSNPKLKLKNQAQSFDSSLEKMKNIKISSKIETLTSCSVPPLKPNKPSVPPLKPSKKPKSTSTLELLLTKKTEIDYQTSNSSTIRRNSKLKP